jgi:hypothetical protein
LNEEVQAKEAKNEELKDVIEIVGGEIEKIK